MQVTPIASAASSFGAGASAATFASAMRDMAAGALPVPVPAPALALTAAVLPPVSVRTLSSEHACARGSECLLSVACHQPWIP